MANFLLEGQKSERLQYRRVLKEDFKAWLPFYHDPSSTEFWDGLPKNPIKACEQQFERIFERYQKKLGGMNALIHKDSKELIGLCGLLVQEVSGKEELEIGYSILPNYRKQGYAFEAANKCKNFAKQNLLTKNLISIIHIKNIPSQKVALKNGMKIDTKTTYKNNPVYIYRVHL